MDTILCPLEKVNPKHRTGAEDHYNQMLRSKVAYWHTWPCTERDPSGNGRLDCHQISQQPPSLDVVSPQTSPVALGKRFEVHSCPPKTVVVLMDTGHFTDGVCNDTSCDFDGTHGPSATPDFNFTDVHDVNSQTKGSLQPTAETPYVVEQQCHNSICSDSKMHLDSEQGALHPTRLAKPYITLAEWEAANTNDGVTQPLSVNDKSKCAMQQKQPCLQSHTGQGQLQTALYDPGYVE